MEISCIYIEAIIISADPVWINKSFMVNNNNIYLQQAVLVNTSVGTGGSYTALSVVKTILDQTEEANMFVYDCMKTGLSF